jgi:hypothetical protein
VTSSRTGSAVPTARTAGADPVSGSASSGVEYRRPPSVSSRLVVRTLTDPRQGRLFRALIAASLCDSRAQQALHRFYAIRIDEWAGCVTEAEKRGEVPEATDATAVIAAVSAPLYYAMLNTGAPLDEAHADRAAAAACAAARAGAYVSANAR